MPACWFRPIHAHAAVVANKTFSVNLTQPLSAKLYMISFLLYVLLFVLCLLQTRDKEHCGSS